MNKLIFLGLAATAVGATIAAGAPNWAWFFVGEIGVVFGAFYTVLGISISRRGSKTQ